ncbi:Methylmalonyl-CoA mutase [Paraburkholderia kirstenboschensis]|uniref:methylmalonyl-CoA mutase n=1 Tax=Paraburkholderia kirstenboschensis TaxID=1245436 RepID=UPI000AC98027|nr:methylmalonyl-CoA mutase [Paraburkholderia kirstenboschensis]CAD6560345.1 Methylmalonyl-CoA mutase [Paraburkholderia kirstenboschensis]
MSPQEKPRTVPLRQLYSSADLSGIDHLDSLPGNAPFVRGPYPSMYTHKPWTIRQYTGYADAADSNLAFRAALQDGAQGLSVAFDLPTQRGYDSTDAEALADVGMAGVAIDTVEDVARLFAGIPLDRVSVSMTMNGAVLPVLAAFIVAAQESGVSADALSGTIQNDILKEYMVRNTWIHAPEPSMRIVADVADYLAARMPRFNALSVSGYHFQEAGADPVLELALTFANAREYVTTLSRRGRTPDDVCAQLSFFFGVGTDFFVEVAKLRAARIVWSRIASGLGARSTKALALRMHCQTSGWSLSAHRPQNNIVRTAVEAMAAVFGGTQSLHTNAYDEALALPSAASSRLARDTQLILQHEMGLCDVVDPWAGSYMMESLTADIVAKTEAAMAEMDAHGGVLAAIHSGWVQQRIRACAAKTQARIDSGGTRIVGENCFRDESSDVAPECLEVDNRHVRQLQALRIQAVRGQRNDRDVAASLARLAQTARNGQGNLLAATVECIRLRATVGECTRALEAVWPRYMPPRTNSTGHYGNERRNDPQWARACSDVQALTGELRKRPRILIAKIGQDGHDRGMKIVAGGLSDAGFDVREGQLFESVSEIVERTVQCECEILGISTMAGAHLTVVPQLLTELASRGLGIPVVVGGIVAHAHHRQLFDHGVAAIFGPGTPIETIVRILCDLSAKHRVRERTAREINAAVPDARNGVAPLPSMVTASHSPSPLMSFSE